MTLIAGVDLGVRKVAVSLFHDGNIDRVQHLVVPKTSRAQELRTLSQWVWMFTRRCDSVFIEEPLVGRNTRTSLMISQTAGAVMSALAAHVQYLDLVPVGTWKKAVLSNGSMDKPGIASWLTENYPSYSSLCDGNQDRIDATCIGLYGVGVSDRAGSLDHL